MARPLFWAFAGLLLASAPAGASDEICEATQQQQQKAGQPPAGRADNSGGRGDRDGRGDRKFWWIDPKLRADLGITDQQSAAVEQIWQKSRPALIEMREKLDKMDKALSQMISDGVDEKKVIAQIELVENTRAEANKSRTLMIYRMNKVLTPDQRAKVRAMFEQNDPRHRGGRGNR
jgi:Spy/CpxP family protein refolding chaperone